MPRAQNFVHRRRVACAPEEAEELKRP
jgi:hypothetical protein